MGRGGNANNPVGSSIQSHPVANLTELPTKKQIKDAIPAHCFHRSTPISLALVVRDGLIISGLAYAAWNFLPTENISLPMWAAWTAYWFLQGTAFTGWWVLAHECGHGAFSDNKVIQDTVGFILHSFLLVPYFSWQYSHAKHHAKTNHLLDGETHVPPSTKYRRQFEKLHHAVGEDAFAAWELLAHLLFGWPMYLAVNATGARRTPDGDRITSVHDHFRPSSKLFPSNGAWNTRVMASTLGVLGVIAGLFHAGSIYGGTKIFMMYFPAYLWTNFWLVLYTWLQHTDETIPHFGEDEWTWVRGALCTIDRPYGVFDWMHHHIGSTHVAHHLFSNIPCYHAQEATKALKAYLEPMGLYNYDPRNFVSAAWHVAHTCHYVEGIEGVQYYMNLTKAAAAKKAAKSAAAKKVE